MDRSLSDPWTLPMPRLVLPMLPAPSRRLPARRPMARRRLQLQRPRPHPAPHQQPLAPAAHPAATPPRRRSFQPPAPTPPPPAPVSPMPASHRPLPCSSRRSWMRASATRVLPRSERAPLRLRSAESRDVRPPRCAGWDARGLGAWARDAWVSYRCDADTPARPSRHPTATRGTRSDHGPAARAARRCVAAGSPRVAGAAAVHASAR